MRMEDEEQNIPGGWSRIVGKGKNKRLANAASPGMNDETYDPDHNQVRRVSVNHGRVSKRPDRVTEGRWRPGKRNYQRTLKRGRNTEGVWHPQVRGRGQTEIGQ